MSLRICAQVYIILDTLLNRNINWKNNLRVFNITNKEANVIWEVQNFAKFCNFKVPTFLKLGFIPCNAKQLLQDMELKKGNTKKLKHTGNLLRKNLQLKDVC